MYAYVDESGNTGNQIFDPNQPLFITAAMMTRTNFDAIRKNALAAIARKVGAQALHANELGVARIEDIADDLLQIVKQADARFFISRLEKRYLATSKVFDTYFDAGENLAVPWQAYWLKPLRLTLMFKLASYVITEEIAMTVWNCLTAPNEQKSKPFFLEAAAAMLARAPNLPDPRSRQIVSEALQWALENPENFTTNIKDKIAKNTHSPNFVAFTNLMDGLDRASKALKSPIQEIVHDRQSQFEETLRHWHAVYSRPDLADAEFPRWPGTNESMSLSKAPGSKFRIATEETSPGLQVVDVVLWLFKRIVTDKDIGPHGARLLNQVFKRARQNDMSFDGVGDSVQRQMDEMMNAELTDKQQVDGAHLRAKAEENRIAAMKEYAAQKSKGRD